MVQLPAETAASCPVWETLATDSSELAQKTALGCALAGVTVYSSRMGSESSDRVRTDSEKATALTAGALVGSVLLSLAEGGAGVFEQPAAPSDRQTAAVKAAKMRFFIKTPPFLLLYTFFLKLQPFPQA